MAAHRTHQLASEIGAPDLAEPGWYQLVGAQYHDGGTALSPEGQRIADRKARKAAQRRFLDALGKAA